MRKYKLGAQTKHVDRGMNSTQAPIPTLNTECEGQLVKIPSEGVEVYRAEEVDNVVGELDKLITNIKACGFTQHQEEYVNAALTILESFGSV